MKFFLLLTTLFALSITALHAQVPAPTADPEAAAITSVLPSSWQGYATIALVLIPLLGRGWHAWITNGGAKGIWSAIVFGTNTPKILIASLALLTLPSCTALKKVGASLSTPQAKAVEVQLANLGIQEAVNLGKLSPGDAVSIGNGIAVVTSGNSTVSKMVQLSEIGLDTAAQKGLISPGDNLIIKATTAVLTQALAPTTPAAALTPATPPTAAATATSGN